MLDRLKALWDTEKAIPASAASASKAPREDDGLPFGLRVGSLVDTSTLVMPRPDSLVPAKPLSPVEVVAVSVVDFQMSGTLHRFYFETGDTPENPETYLQVYSDAQGRVQEVWYFERLLRMFPGSEQELGLFLGETPGEGLGAREFSLWRNQLAELGYADARLDRVFGQEEGRAYLRADGRDDDYVSPMQGEEERIDDGQGTQGLNQRIVCMPYNCELAVGREQLWIQTEVVRSQNNSVVQAARVDLMIGVDVAIEDVKTL